MGRTYGSYYSLYTFFNGLKSVATIFDRGCIKSHFSLEFTPAPFGRIWRRLGWISKANKLGALSR